jgi:hypothetical protein
MVAVKSTAAWSSRPTHHKGCDRTLGGVPGIDQSHVFARVQFCVFPKVLSIFILFLLKATAR